MTALVEKLVEDLIVSSALAALKRITDGGRRERVLNKAIERIRFDSAGNAKLDALKKARTK